MACQSQQSHLSLIQLVMASAHHITMTAAIR